MEGDRTSSGAALVGGTVLISFCEYLKKIRGKGAVDEMAKNISYSLAEVTPAGDYPAEYADETLRYIHETCGLDAIRNLGRFNFENIGSRRYLMKMLSLESSLERIAESYNKLTNKGRMDLKRVGGGYQIDLEMAPNKKAGMNDLYAEMWRGTFEEALRFLRASGSVTLDKGRLSSENVVQISLKLGK